MDNSSQSGTDSVSGPVVDVPVKKSRGRPTEKDVRGRFVKREDTQERRRLSAEMKARGASWTTIAAAHWGGDRGLAIRQLRQWYAENPSEDVLTQRRIMADGLENIESIVREVMSRKHYVVGQRGVVLDAKGEPLEDDEPIYRGVDRILKVKELLVKITPGLAAPKVVAEISADALDIEIEYARQELAKERALLQAEEGEDEKNEA